MLTKEINLPQDYTLFQTEYQLSMPLDVVLNIPKDAPVRLLHEIMEGLDYSKLLATYSRKGRKPAVHPATLFKILVFSYMNGIFSSHKISEACLRDTHFLWLLRGFKPPCQKTISSFRTERLTDGILDDLFQQFNQKLVELNEIQLQNLFIDGSKFEANANKFSFVWKKAILKFRERFYEKTKVMLDIFNERYGTNHHFQQKTIKKTLRHCLTTLNTVIEEMGIVFVHGIGKRKQPIQKLHEEISEYLEKLLEYDLKLEIIGDNRNSCSKVDLDATFLRMKDDYMKNGQLKAGYNVQIAVESQYIVAVEIFQNANDTNTLIPFLNKISKQFGVDKPFENIVADAGYESEENYKYLKEKAFVPYIKPLNFEQSRKKSFSKQIGRRENMTYNLETDTYTCANNKSLHFKEVKTRTSMTGYERKVSIYECEDCTSCPLREKCSKSKNPNRAKTIEVAKGMVDLREESRTNISTEFGTQLRMNRSIQVEGAFGVLKQDYGFRRFLTRGKTNVSVEFSLLAFAYNMNKLHNKIQKDKCQFHLYELKEAK